MKLSIRLRGGQEDHISQLQFNFNVRNPDTLVRGCAACRRTGVSALRMQAAPLNVRNPDTLVRGCAAGKADRNV
jgi:hypothetical protein